MLYTLVTNHLFVACVVKHLLEKQRLETMNVYILEKNHINVNFAVQHSGIRLHFNFVFCNLIYIIYAFSQRSNLQSHKRATHYDDKRYKCTDCGKGFKRRRLLDYHMKAAHTGERPFKCEVCQASFIYPEHFKKHARIHTGEKPYLCEVRSQNILIFILQLHIDIIFI